MKTLFAIISLLAGVGHFSMGQAAKPNPYRPTYHFTPPKNWMNDPNGLVYYGGEYHLFYQHNPFANQWGHMSWGHAISRDLVHWQDLPIAMRESAPGADSSQTMIFSGSAVVDSANRQRLCPPGTKDCLVAFYTSHVHRRLKPLVQHQSMAFSADNGRTWTQYDKNPIIDLNLVDFRDPKVFWYAPEKKWIMVVVVPDKHKVLFYGATDMRHWEKLSEFGGVGDQRKFWECPDLVEVPVAKQSGNLAGGNPARKTKWVLLLSSNQQQAGYTGMQYFVGNFDGRTFTPDEAIPVARYVDAGKDFYAGVTYNNLPAQSQEPVLMGWMTNLEYAGSIPTSTYKGTMSVPRQLSVVSTSTGWQLRQAPVNPLQALRQPGLTRSAVRLANQTISLPPLSTDAYEIDIQLEPGQAEEVGLRLLKNATDETVVRFRPQTSRLELDRTRSGQIAFSNRFPSVESAPLSVQHGLVHLRILVDRSTIELFANDGEVTMSELVFPRSASGQIELYATGGTAIIRQLHVWPLKTSWSGERGQSVGNPLHD